MFRANIFDNIGFYDENFDRCQDYELYMRIMANYKVCNIPEILYQWRDNENFHKKISERKKFVMMARYKQYCEIMNIDFDIHNFGRVYF